jgi:zinc transport system substrate-binding protein
MLTLVVMKRLTVTGVTTLLLGSAATGCATAEDRESPSTGPLQVVAAFYPLAYVAERVGGPGVAVTNLTQPGAEPHDLELRPKQVATLARADVVIYEQGFQPAVDEAVDQNPPKAAIDVTRVVPLENTGIPQGDDPAGDAADHEGHDHESLNGDPHVWLDPANLGRIAEAVADTFIDARPDASGGFTERLAAVQDDLGELDDDYRNGVANCQRRVFVTSHGAFGYLAQRYGLDMVAVSGLDPDAEPSPARLAEVAHVVRTTGVTTIFSERLVSAKVAETLAADVGVSTAVLDPIEGLTDETAGEDYLSLMRANLAALREANGCS